MPDHQTDSRLNLPSEMEPGLTLQVNTAVAAVRKHPRPDAEMLTQILFGETVRLATEEGEFGLIQADRDRYVGWVLMEALSAPVVSATHWVSALRTYTFSEPALRAAPYEPLCLGACVSLTGKREGRFAEIERRGWITEDHIMPLGRYETDPAGVAERYLHTPYLWGGRESLGLDCSGLTQQAFAACGIRLPRDSDMQCHWAGMPIEAWDTDRALRRNDLVFWNGHVGIMMSADELLHSNAHHMRVAREPLREAIARIEPLYGRPIGARRIPLPTDQKPIWLS